MMSRGESGWCSDVTSTHGAWRHAGVRFFLPGATIKVGQGAEAEVGIEPMRADPSAFQAAVSTASTHPHPEIGRGEGQAGIGPTRADPKALHSVRLTTIRAAAANHCALLPFTAHLAHDSGAKRTERPSQLPDRAIKQTVMALG